MAIHESKQSLSHHSVGVIAAALECYRNDNQLRSVHAHNKADNAPSITERNDYRRASSDFTAKAAEAEILRDMLEDADGATITVAVSGR